ncbi:MAG: RNA methyltransferase [Lentisphaeria bacterium]|nr:RNA methyltransferase [Lentisphaeria bacterium]
MELSRAQAALIRALFTRHGRKKNRCCVVEGPRAVGELLAGRPESVRFLVRSANVPFDPQGHPMAELTESRFAELSSTVNSQGILAVAEIPQEPGMEDAPADPWIFALDRVADPGNFGTICRTARASGLTELWLTVGTADPYGDKALRSGLGSQFTMRFRTFPDLAALQQAAAHFGYGPVWLTDPHRGNDLFAEEALYERSVLVIGSEGGGVAELEGAPRVHIPMPGNFESLNAAQAATIFLFEAVRRMRIAAHS